MDDLFMRRYISVSRHSMAYKRSVGRHDRRLRRLVKKKEINMVNSTLDEYRSGGSDAAASGVSWGAVIAGAFAAAALSFILIILGFGLGFSAISPWSGSGASAQTIGISTVLWITFTQIAASAVGGYLAGRLRVRWVSMHTDEVYFRDTAHGFLTWAVASLAAAALLSSAIGGVVSGGAKAVSAAGAAIATTGAAAMSADSGSGSDATDGLSAYFIDTLFRPNAAAGSTAPAAEANGNAHPIASSADTGNRGGAVTPAQRTEVARIFANALRTGRLGDADKTYVAQIVAQRTGMSQADAAKRVDDAYASYTRTVSDATAKAKQAADTARKAAAYGALWMFVALLCGAFVASFSATYGGRLRDRVEYVSAKPSTYSTTTAPKAI
jgi:hypothetical protein